jgi:P27 family predicted phage terminase small subunit
MGQRGPIGKPEDRRQRKRPRTKEVLPAVIPLALPDENTAEALPAENTAPQPPAGLLKATRNRWLEFWRSELASVVTPTDVPALERLYTLYDERERALRDFRKARMVRGSQGQMVLNPMGRLVKDLDSEIRALEDRFGLTPQARLRLGITFADNADSLDRLNEIARKNAPSQATTPDDDDPRLG